MKKTRLLPLAAGLLMLGACSGPGEGQPLSDFKDAGQADSLSYFYGAMYADNYWRISAGDSAAREEKARKRYLEGVEKGMSLGGDDKQYNDGLMVGLQFATGIRDLEKELGVKLDKKVILSAMAYGLRADSTIDMAAAQQGLQMILQTLGEKKDKENAANAQKTVAAAAKKDGLKLMAEGVYGKTLKPGSGALLKDGDIVKVEMQMASLGGKKVSFPMPTELRVGTEFQGTPLHAAIVQLHTQESVVMYVSAYSMFGQGCSRMGYEPSDVLRVDLATLGLKPATEEAASSPAE